jgi:ATP diphosphatase
MTQQAPDITPLHQIMTQLRDPVGGCEWDVAQNFRSIAPYTIEEAYEVADAIERDDMAALKDELGDLLLQVVFHAQMADESGHFSLSDVISVICEKMMRRHPHIFAQEDRDASGQMLIRANWEAIKAQERAKKGEADSALSGVANALPALMRAEKLQKRAARVGFDWTEIEPVRAKIVEEMDELDAAPDEAARQEEAGDLLFAAVNLVRHYRIDPEVALRQGNAKFERRFRAMEALAGGAFASLSLDEQEALWQKVKEAQGL